MRFCYDAPVTLKVRHLQLVQAIQQEGNLSRAARRLAVTQPAVSRGLRALEEELGLLLFERGGGTAAATPAGEQLVEVADRVLPILDRVEADLQLRATGRKGRLRLATECYTCYHWLPAVLARFRQRHPGHEVEIVPEATRRPMEALRARELDLAITHTPSGAADLRSVPLFRDELVAVVAPGHPLAARPRLAPRDFADQELVLHSDPAGSVVFRAFLDPAGVGPRRLSLLQLTEAVVAAVEAELGVSVLARWAVAPEVERGRLVAIPLAPDGLYREWSATFPAREGHSRVLADLVALLQEVRLAGEEAPAGSRSLARV
jgi:LysR family transcriptional regulator for metE and metH